MMATDRYVGAWSYAGGRYEIDDDLWACLFASSTAMPPS
jgi:hypothetical protein